MRRLNVQFLQIQECISTSLFAVDALPQAHPLQPGEPLLLQLVMTDARRLNRVDERIQFALMFDRATRDLNGARSREHWPNAGKTWNWILECSETIPTIPFSLERLGLSKDYGGQTNPQFIEPADELIVRPYLKGASLPAELPALASVHKLLSTIRNYDEVVKLSPVRVSRVMEHTRRLSDPWLGDALKTYYEHRCQICLHDFKPRYGVPYADTRFLIPIDGGGEPVSRNLVVVCPNHNAIIGAANAGFHQETLSFQFPNGLREKLTLRDHLL